MKTLREIVYFLKWLVLDLVSNLSFRQLLSTFYLLACISLFFTSDKTSTIILFICAGILLFVMFLSLIYDLFILPKWNQYQSLQHTDKE